MEPSHLDFINGLGYVPVGVGDKKFSDKWMRDNVGDNISDKNKYYSEFTFHYWIWKNYIDKIEDNWFGFCQYRKFWSKEVFIDETLNINNINEHVLKEIPEKYNKYETILTDPQFVNEWKTSKFLKKGLHLFLQNPSLIFNKNKRNINFHFDLMHGKNKLKEAIDLLDEKNKEDFKKFVNSEVSFNPHVMIICNSKKKLKLFYEDLFPWLKKCEAHFGFEDLVGYGKTRMYGFLAERFMSFWFQKYTKYTTKPILFYDIRKDIK